MVEKVGANHKNYSWGDKIKIFAVCTVLGLFSIQKFSEYMRDSIIKDIIESTCSDTSQIIQESCKRTDREEFFGRILFKIDGPIHSQIKFTESQIREALVEEKQMKEFKARIQKIEEEKQELGKEIMRKQEEIERLKETGKNSERTWSNGDLFGTGKTFIKRFTEGLL